MILQLHIEAVPGSLRVDRVVHAVAELYTKNHLGLRCRYMEAGVLWSRWEWGV